MFTYTEQHVHEANELARDLGFDDYESADVETRREIAGALRYAQDLAAGGAL